MNFMAKTAIKTAPIMGVSVASIPAVRKADKSVVSRGDAWKIDVTKLVHSTDYDVRLIANADYYQQPHVKSMIAGIENDILAKRRTDAIQISFIEGNPIVVGGFKTYRAAMKAQKSTGETILVPVVDAGKSREEVILNNLKRNRVDNYSQVELGLLYKSMLEGGICERELQTAFSVTKNQIRAAVATLSLPDDVQAMIVNRQISPAQWDAMVKDYGENNALEIATEVAQSEGKVTKGKVEKATSQESQPHEVAKRKSKSAIYKSMQTVLSDFIPKVKSSDYDKDGNILVSVTPEQVKMLLALETDIQD